MTKFFPILPWRPAAELKEDIHDEDGTQFQGSCFVLFYFFEIKSFTFFLPFFER